MDFKTYYHAFTDRGGEADEAALKHAEEIRRLLTEALLAEGVFGRRGAPQVVHSVDRLLNRKRKPRSARPEVIDVVAWEAK